MLTIHDLHLSQSERIVWLCEELQIPYSLKLYQRLPSSRLRHSSADVPWYPLVIADGTLTLAESGAIEEYIIYKHSDGRLALPPSHPAYGDYLYWFHFSSVSIQAIIGRNMMIRAAQLPTDHPIVKNVDARLRNVLRLLDLRLKHATWLAGDEFTAADTMSVSSLTKVQMFMPFDLSGYPQMLRYLGRDAMAKGDPGFTPILSGPARELFWLRRYRLKLRNVGKLQIRKAEIDLILYMS